MASKAKQNHNESGASPASSVAVSRGSLKLGSFKVPLVLIIVLSFLALSPRVQGNDVLFWSFVGAILLLASWFIYLFALSWNSGEDRLFEIVLRPQHYIQAMVQFSVYAYWGYYWRPVYELSLIHI